MTRRPSVCIVGAGQLGSRHLQALHGVKEFLRIQVVDPSTQSLTTARERFESITPPSSHDVTYAERLDPSTGPLDVAIIATNADHRRDAVEAVLATTGTRYFILEKYLFTKREDYSAVFALLKKNNVKAWVNCSMRTQTIYADLKATLVGQSVDYAVSGSQYGLITNAIHFLDYLAWITDQDDFVVETQYLDPTPFSSKRLGFLELHGTLLVHGKRHSHGIFTCYPTGDAPIFMSFQTPTARYLTRDAEQKAFLASASSGWKWSEIEAPVPFQSTMTTHVISELLEHGTCALAPYDLSVKLHLTLLDALHDFLRTRTGYTGTAYPFT